MTRRNRFGNVRKLPSGRWQARYQKGEGWLNAPRTFREKQAALDWLDDQAVDRRRGTWVDPRGGKETFRALEGLWEASQVTLRASTAKRDFGYAQRYAVAAFGDKPIGEIDHLLLAQWVADLNRRLAPATVAKALQIVSKVFQYAVDAGMLPANPAAKVKPPKIEREEMRFLAVDEIEALTEAMDKRYRAVVPVGCWGGLRAGELFGLKPKRVNVVTGATRVTENIVETEGYLFTEPCKTKASRRTITLPEVARQELRLHQMGREYVFEAPKGGPVRLKNWRDRFWHPACDDAGIGYVRPHDMRHTCAALLIKAGVNPLGVSRWLGHESVAFTLDRYGHLDHDWATSVSDTLARFWHGEGEPEAG